MFRYEDTQGLIGTWVVSGHPTQPDEQGRQFVACSYVPQNPRDSSPVGVKLFATSQEVISIGQRDRRTGPVDRRQFGSLARELDIAVREEDQLENLIEEDQ